MTKRIEVLMQNIFIEKLGIVEQVEREANSTVGDDLIEQRRAIDPHISELAEKH